MHKHAFQASGRPYIVSKALAANSVTVDAGNSIAATTPFNSRCGGGRDEVRSEPRELLDTSFWRTSKRDVEIHVGRTVD